MLRKRGENKKRSGWDRSTMRDGRKKNKGRDRRRKTKEKIKKNGIELRKWGWEKKEEQRRSGDDRKYGKEREKQIGKEQ